jgi:deoxyribodipyrimidine photo-lyase
MQSGTTGINVPRVYNPIKQAKDHDPHGIFVRRWLPAMREVPQAWLFEPWRMPDSIQQSCGVIVGQSLPFPLVDLVTATRLAKAKMLARRSDSTAKAGKFAIIERHASRKKIADLKHLKQAQLGWDWT